MSTKPILVVMAAGMGSRYGGLKQIDPVGSHGEVILDYSLYDAYQAGFETAVIIIKKAIEKDFMQTVGARLARCPMQIRYAYQELEMIPAGFTIPQQRQKPWGTGHAVLCAKDVIGKAPFAVINSDDYYGRSAFAVIYDYLCGAADAEKYDYCLVGYQLGNTVTEHGHVARGVCSVSKSGYLQTIDERCRVEKYAGGIHYTEDGGSTWTELAEDTPVSMNMWGYTSSFLKELEMRFPKFLGEEVPENPLKAEFFLPVEVGRLLREGKAAVKMLSSKDKWYGVTYAEDKPQVVAALAEMTRRGIYPDGLWK